ncbi:MAG: Uma2 family endonuclease [Gemmatimonadetes bacterium]|nr:Uma2 family endonuclease [Gemmatimonadota bacterium]
MPATKVTWRDVLEMPEDGNRYEAIGGELYVSPPPRPRHQWVSAGLFAALHDLLVRPGHGYLFYAPIGVEFLETEEGVQPDILFVSKERFHIVTEDWIQGAPDLVIEIPSPSTARRDRTVKRHLYQRQGVPEYWIVDPDAKQVEVWRFAAGATEPERYADVLPVRLGDRLIGEIPLSKIFDWPR